ADADRVLLRRPARGHDHRLDDLPERVRGRARAGRFGPGADRTAGHSPLSPRRDRRSVRRTPRHPVHQGRPPADLVTGALADIQRAGGAILIDLELTCWPDSLATGWADPARPAEVLEIGRAVCRPPARAV